MLASFLALAGVALIGGPAAAASLTTCTGGTLAAGTYGAVVVTGYCTAEEDGHTTITGGLTIAPGGALDAGGLGFASPCFATFDISGGVRVQKNGALGLGNSENGTGCPDSNNIVRGGLSAVGATAVVVHGTTIANSGLVYTGGGGGTRCEPIPPALPFGPFFDVEDSVINGGVAVRNLSSCWFGFIRNQVNNSGVVIRDNNMGDPDAMEVGLNVIHGGLSCRNNSPVVTNSFDGSPPNPNTVTGGEYGECVGL